MRWLLAILFACPLVAFGAAGDIKWAFPETNGTYLTVCVDTIATNGGFDFHLSTNVSVASYSGTPYTNYTFSPTANTPYLTITSPGYDANHATTTVSRVVYLTKQLRLPAPDSTTTVYANDITNSGSDAVFRVALEKPVYIADTTISLTAPTSFYSNQNSVASLALTNNSTLAYHKVIGRWVLEKRRPVNGSTTIEACAFHAYPRSGKPIAAMMFRATGETSAHSVTNYVTAMSKSSRDGQPVYAGSLDLSVSGGFTRGEVVDIDFTAYPWVGDSAATLDSVADVGTLQSDFGTLKWTIMDKLIAVVDPASGNDSTGIASTSQSAADAAPVATISGGLTKIAATNNLVYSLNRIDGGEVQCLAGNYNTGKYSTQTSANGYFTITHHSSTTRSGVVFTNYVTSSQAYKYQRYYDVTFTRSGNTIIIVEPTSGSLVMESVAFMDGNTSWYNSDTSNDLQYLDCITTNSYFSLGGNAALSSLIRNCVYTNMFGTQVALGNCQCVFGALLNTNSAIWAPRIDNFNNIVLFGIKQYQGPQSWSLSKTLNNCAIVQNEIEVTTGVTQPLLSISTYTFTNILVSRGSGKRFCPVMSPVQSVAYWPVSDEGRVCNPEVSSVISG